MSHYEIYELGLKARAVPGTFALQDTAIEAAGKWSVTSGRVGLVVRFDGLERSIRAFATDGHVTWARDCTSCDGTGLGFGDGYCDRCAGIGAVRDYDSHPAYVAKAKPPSSCTTRTITMPAPAPRYFGWAKP